MMNNGMMQRRTPQQFGTGRVMPQSGGMQRPVRQAAAPPAKQSGGGMGQMMGGAMGSMMSDEDSKKEIERLEGANDALTKALDSSATKTPQSNNMPATEYPSLPSRTSFADTPAANKVAAQNVAMQPGAGAPPPQGMQPDPQQMNMARSQNPAFNVQGGPPDLSALDEAYKRMGRGG